MRRNAISLSFAIAVLCPLMLSAIGCQTEIRKQAPATQGNVVDSLEYIPAGPEFKLSNQVQAHEEYKLEREKLRAGVDDEAGQ